MADEAALSVKEWLERLDGKIDKLDDKLDAKADLRLVTEVQARVLAIEREHDRRAGIPEQVERNRQTIEKLQEGKVDTRDFATLRNQMLGFVISVALIFCAWALNVAGKI